MTNTTAVRRPTASTITDDQLDALHAKVDALEAACGETAADALQHRGCHRTHGGLVLRAERAEGERDQARELAVALENQLAAITEYARTSDHDGIRTRETVLRIAEGSDTADLAAAVRALAEEFAAGARTVDACAVRERLLALVAPRVEHVAGDPDYCPACRLLPAASVPQPLCPGPGEQP